MIIVNGKPEPKLENEKTVLEKLQDSPWEFHQFLGLTNNPKTYFLEYKLEKVKYLKKLGFEEVKNYKDVLLPDVRFVYYSQEEGITIFLIVLEMNYYQMAYKYYEQLGLEDMYIFGKMYELARHAYCQAAEDFSQDN